MCSVSPHEKVQPVEASVSSPSSLTSPRLSVSWLSGSMRTLHKTCPVQNLASREHLRNANIAFPDAFKHVTSSSVSIMTFAPPPQQLPGASLLDRVQRLFQACSLYWNGFTSSLPLSRTDQHSVMANCVVQSPRRGCMAKSPLLVAGSNSVRPHSY